MWIKVKNWSGHLYPDPKGKPVEVGDGTVIELPDEYGASVIEKGFAVETTRPGEDAPKAAKPRRRKAPATEPASPAAPDAAPDSPAAAADAADETANT